MDSFKLKNRVLAVLLCLVTVGGIAIGVFFKGSGKTEASTSLAGIMELKTSGKEYTILEIVPDVSQAAFAWYVGGSEPVNERKLSIAYSGDTDGFVTSYTNTTTMLQTQNYLLPSSASSDPSAGILQFLGEVKASGSSVTGGFSNNEWFLRYVLDWTEDEVMPAITVMTVSPENVTTGHIAMADMVVLSGGYYYPDSATTPNAYSTTSDGNLKNDVTEAILSRISSAGSSGSLGMPLILDRRAYNEDAGSSLNSNRLFHEILKNDPRSVSSGVYGSVFYFSSVLSADEVGNAISLTDGGQLGLSSGHNMGFLVTSQFNTPFVSSISGSTGPFADVLKSIQSENATRGGVNLLSEEITMARVIRYLVGGTSLESTVTINEKSNITILSVQPDNSSGVATYDGNKHSSFGLPSPSVTAKVSLPVNVGVSATADQVSWDDLEKWTGVSRSNITVVEKTVSEFVLSNEVLNGTYDLIYIGNDISAMNYGVYQETTHFVTDSQVMADPSGNSYFAPFGTDFLTPATSYTQSVNDISAAKYAELVDYVTAGRPVVLAPYLCAGLNWRTDVTTPATSSVDKNSNMYKFLSSASGRSNVIRQDMLIAGPDGVEGNSDDNTMIATCVDAVNIPTPTIEFMTMSAGSEVKSSIATYNGTAQNVLEYIFQITNDTVSNASGVSYYLSVDLDMDGDGLYETDCTRFTNFTLEQLQTTISGDLVLDGSMEPIRETDARYDNVKQNQYYRLTVVLPDWIDGIVPWMITVNSYNNEGGVAAVSAVTMTLSAEPTSVKVLQIMPTMASSLNLESGSIFNNLIQSSTVTELMNVSVTSIDASQVSSYSFTDYDVLVLGFGSGVIDEVGDALVSAYATSGGTVIFAAGSFDGSYPLADSVESASNSDIFTTYPYELSESDLTGVTLWTATNNSDMYYITQDLQDGSGETPNKVFVNLLLTASSSGDDVPESGGGGSSSLPSFDGEFVASSTSTGFTTRPLGDSVQYLITTSALNSSGNQVPVYFKLSGTYSQIRFGLICKEVEFSSSTGNILKFTVYDSGTSSLVRGAEYNFGDVLTISSGTLDDVIFQTYLVPTCTSYMDIGSNIISMFYEVPDDNGAFTKSSVLEFDVQVSENALMGTDFFVFSGSEGEYIESTSGKYYLNASQNYVLFVANRFVKYTGSTLVEDPNGTYYFNNVSKTYEIIPTIFYSYNNTTGYYTVDKNGQYYMDYSDGEYKLFTTPTVKYKETAVHGDRYSSNSNGGYYYDDDLKDYVECPTLYEYKVTSLGEDNLSFLLPQG